MNSPSHSSMVSCSHSSTFSCSHAQLCIILNNMHHLQQALENMSESLEMEQYYQWLEEQDKTVRTEERVAKTAQSLIGDLLKNADEDIQNKISIITQEISEKARPCSTVEIHSTLSAHELHMTHT